MAARLRWPTSTSRDTHHIGPTITASAGALGSLTASVNPDTVDGIGGTIQWSYSVAASAVEYLAKNQTKVEQFTITLDDGNGGIVNRTIEVTITGTNDAPVIAAIAQKNLTEQTDTAPLTATIPVTFTDVDLTDVGHTAKITEAVATGTTTGLALDQAALIALVTPGAVTKNSGSSSGSVDTVVLRRFDGVRLSGQGRSADAHLHGGDRRWRRRRDVADFRRHHHRHE